MITNALSSRHQQTLTGFDKLIKRADAQLAQTTQRWTPRALLVADIVWSDKKEIRTAYLHISYGFAGEWQAPWMIRVWEVTPPVGNQPIEWTIPSQRALSCLEDALELLEKTSHFVLSYAVM
ncbi:MAG: hypothetical protein WAZ19_12840 [Anaerolineae bacterium]